MKKVLIALLFLTSCTPVTLPMQHYGNGFTYLELEGKIKIMHSPTMKAIIFTYEGEKYLVSNDTIKRVR